MIECIWMEQSVTSAAAAVWFVTSRPALNVVQAAGANPSLAAATAASAPPSASCEWYQTLLVTWESEGYDEWYVCLFVCFAAALRRHGATLKGSCRGSYRYNLTVLLKHWQEQHRIRLSCLEKNESSERREISKWGREGFRAGRKSIPGRVLLETKPQMLLNSFEAFSSKQSDSTKDGRTSWIFGESQQRITSLLV